MKIKVIDIMINTFLLVHELKLCCSLIKYSDIFNFVWIWHSVISGHQWSQNNL